MHDAYSVLNLKVKEIKFPDIITNVTKLETGIHREMGRAQEEARSFWNSRAGRAFKQAKHPVKPRATPSTMSVWQAEFKYHIENKILPSALERVFSEF